jgi:hypothetical protein
LDRRLGGPQSRSGYGGEEKNSELLRGLEPQIIHPVAQRYTTEVKNTWSYTFTPQYVFMEWCFVKSRYNLAF